MRIKRIKTTHNKPNSDKCPRDYLFASNIDESTFERLWVGCGLFRAVTATLWKPQRAVLYRIMPKNQHEHFREAFANSLSRLLSQMNLAACTRDWESSGSCRVCGTHTSKEPDYAFRPGPIPTSGHSPPPSLILEVGVQWWPENAPVRPRMVGTIHGNTSSPFKVVIEVWKECPFDTQHDTGNSPSIRFQRTQHIEIEGGVILTEDQAIRAIERSKRSAELYSLTV
ncbi:unnamed protein product [Penicillium salamii]|nr:unnamed protein product [Penicillium salamii]